MKKSNQHDIDLLFSTGLENHSIALNDPDALWDRITQEGKRRRVLPFFYSGMAVLLFSVSGGAWYTLENYNVNSVKHSISFSNIQKTTEINSIETDTPANIISSAYSASSVTVEDLVQDEGERILQSADVRKTELLSTELSKKLNDTRPAKIEDVQDTNVFQAKRSNENDKLKINDSFKEANETTIEKSTVSPKSSLPIISKIKREEVHLKNIERLDMQFIQIKDVKEHLAVVKRKMKNPLDDCVVGKDGVFFGAVYGLGGLSLENNSLRAGAQDQQAYLNNWNEAYSSLPINGAGIQIGYELPIGLSASAGMEYAQFESQYTSTQTITEVTTVYNPEAYFYYDDNNQIVYVGDSVTAVTTYDRKSSLASSTSQLNIPITLSYRLYNRGLFSVSAMAGASFNFSMSHEGHFLQPDNSIVRIDNTNADTYVPERIGLAFQGGVRLGYAVAPKWEAFLNPLFQYNGTSYWRDNQTIIQTRNFINVRGGVRYAF